MAGEKRDSKAGTLAKGRKPCFVRTDANRIKRLSRSGWRRAKGRDNKIRRRLRGAMPSPSFGAPKAVRGMHPVGLLEVLVHNVRELTVAGKSMVVRVASSVGNRKKIMIVKEAKKLGIHVLNPRIRVKPKTSEKKKKSGEKAGEEKGEKANEAKEEKK